MKGPNFIRKWRTALRSWFVGKCTRLLTQPLSAYEQRVPNNLQRLKNTLRKGDVLLVEGDQRVSQIIRYLTQSSWSHSALYIGGELLGNGYGQAEAIRQRFGDEASYLLIEAAVGEGVIASPLSKYVPYNIRICRPQGLRKDDLQTVLRNVIGRLGDRYDVRHVWDLACCFFPVRLVPKRLRARSPRLGSGSPHEAICSSMIAKAFAEVGYPILPRVMIDDTVVPPRWWRRLIARDNRRSRMRFRKRDPALVTPRDFDLSPYFEIVKFNHLGEAHFNYRDIEWEDSEKARARKEKPQTPA